MLFPFGFLRFSCSLLVDCFVKPKRKICPVGGRTSDSDDEEYKHSPSTLPPRSTKQQQHPTSSMKTGVKSLVRVLPPRPIEKPRMSLFAYFLNTKRQRRVSGNNDKRAYSDETNKLDQEDVKVLTQQGLEQVKKRVHKQSLECGVDLEKREQTTMRSRALNPTSTTTLVQSNSTDISSLPIDIESQCSLSSEDYAWESVSIDGGEFEIDDHYSSSFSPRTSCDSTSVEENKLGVNPTFFATMETTEEEDVTEDEVGFSFHRRQLMKRIHSVVERNEKFRGNANSNNNNLNQNFLLNPAYGSRYVEDESSEGGEVVKLETKLKTLKSVVKDGCRATSDVLVGGRAYIGNTTLNLTFADPPSSESGGSCSDSDQMSVCSEMGDGDHEDNERRLGFGNEEEDSLAPIPMLLLEGVSVGIDAMDSNKVTLTWKNAVFQNEEEECNQGGGQYESMDCVSQHPHHSFPPILPSPFDVKTMTSIACQADEDDDVFENSVSSRKPSIQGTKFEETNLEQYRKEEEKQIKPHAVKDFESIDLNSKDYCPELTKKKSVHENVLVSSKNLALKITKPAVSNASKFVVASLKQTRWILRSFRLFVNRLDLFGQSSNKLK